MGCWEESDLESLLGAVRDVNPGGCRGGLDCGRLQPRRKTITWTVRGWVRQYSEERFGSSI